MPDTATRIDEPAFGELVRRHRRELHVHCYRMLGSFDEAEDLVQETFLRAWNKRETFGTPQAWSATDLESSVESSDESAEAPTRESTVDSSDVPAPLPGLRAWLYRIATNACIDAVRRKSRRPSTVASFAEVPWLQPYPDQLLDELAPASTEAGPADQAVSRETIELAYLAALQLLPSRQRAALILRDVLEWSAAETAALLEISVPAANSALQRARATLRERLPERRTDWSFPEIGEVERDLLRRFIDAHERGDIAASVAIVREDIRITMPPHPWLFDGVDAMRAGLERTFGPDSMGDWHLVPTGANRMPTAASYLRVHGETEWKAFKLDVLRIEAGLVVEVTTFGPELFPHLGLPLVLPAPLRDVDHEVGG